MGEQTEIESVVVNCASVVQHAAREGNVPDGSRRALLDALDAVPRERGSPLPQCDHGVQAWECRTCGDAEMDYMRDRAERAERGWDSAERWVERWKRERDRLRADNDRLREALQSVVNPPVVLSTDDPIEVAQWAAETARAALSADAEPEPCAASHHGIGTCERDAGHTGYHGRATGLGYEIEWIEPSRAEGDEHPFERIDHRDALDAFTCRRCGEHRDDAIHRDPREGLDPDERPKSLNELSDEWGLCRPPCTKPAGHDNRCNAGAVPHRGGRPREADPQGPSIGSGASVDGGGDDGRSVAGRWQEHAAHLTNRVRELEAAVRGLLSAIDDVDQAAWLLTMAVGNGDPGWLDNAVAEVQKRHDLAYVGPSSPVSRARAALQEDDDA